MESDRAREASKPPLKKQKTQRRTPTHLPAGEACVPVPVDLGGGEEGATPPRPMLTVVLHGGEEGVPETAVAAWDKLAADVSKNPALA